MTEYLKFYVLHTFSISPHSSRRTTLLNTKVLNLCIRQVANGVRLRFGTWQQCTEIHFIEPGVKVNGAYYRINLLAQKLLQDIFWISQGGFFVCQQDSASSTRHCRFPGAKGARLHSTPHCGRQIQRILAQSTISSICHVGPTAGEGLPIQNCWHR